VREIPGEGVPEPGSGVGGGRDLRASGVNGRTLKTLWKLDGTEQLMGLRLRFV
jgi:hypothetical protein